MTSSSDSADTELVPIEAVCSGDPITDVDGHYYKVLESKPVDGGGVVLELEHHHGNGCDVIEKSFPAGYMVGRKPRRIG
jgi:hypothetical protein